MLHVAATCFEKLLHILRSKQTGLGPASKNHNAAQQDRADPPHRNQSEHQAPPNGNSSVLHEIAANGNSKCFGFHRFFDTSRLSPVQTPYDETLLQ